MTTVHPDVPLVINIKISSSLSVHIDFWVPLFPPCWTEWSGLRSLVAMFRCVKVCSKAILSPSPDRFSLEFSWWSLSEMSGHRKDSLCLLQSLVCPARTLWAPSKSLEELQLVGRYQKQLWRPEAEISRKRNNSWNCYLWLYIVFYLLLQITGFIVAFYSQLN